MSPKTLSEENQVVKAAIDREKNVCLDKRGKKRKYNSSFTSEDRAVIGRYAAEHGNAATVRKFKIAHDVGE